MRLNFRTVKVMLYETIRRNTALQCWNNVATNRNNISTMLQRRIAACAKNRGCEFEWTFEFSTSRKFVLLPFWLSLCFHCLDIVNFLEKMENGYPVVTNKQKALNFIPVDLFNRFTVKAPEIRVMSPDILSHVAQNKQRYLRLCLTSHLHRLPDTVESTFFD